MITFTTPYPGDDDIVVQTRAKMSRNADGTATYTLPEGSREFKGMLPAWCDIPVRALYAIPYVSGRYLIWMIRDNDGPDHKDHLQKVGDQAPEIRDYLESQGIHK